MIPRFYCACRLRRTLGFALFTAISLPAAAAAFAQQAHPATDDRKQPLTITVHGHGEAFGPQNGAEFTATVSETQHLAANALQAAAKRVDELTTALASAGASGDSVRTTYRPLKHDATARVQGPDPKQVEIGGFTVTCDLAVTVRESGKLGLLLDSAVLGGADVHDIVPCVVDTSDLADVALARALADAKHRADTLARAAGGIVTALSEVKEAPVEGSDADPGSLLGAGRRMVASTVSADVIAVYYLGELRHAVSGTTDKQQAKAIP